MSVVNWEYFAIHMQDGGDVYYNRYAPLIQVLCHNTEDTLLKLTSQSQSNMVHCYASVEYSHYEYRCAICFFCA